MPSLQEAIAARKRVDNTYTRVEKSVDAVPPLTSDAAQHLLGDPTMLCPMPPSGANVDNVRQSPFIGGRMPYYRVVTPSTSPVVGGTANETLIERAASSSGVGTSTTTNNPAEAETASITTISLVPNQRVSAAVVMAKGVLMLNVSANASCRVELYGTALAATLDASRPITQFPTPQTIGIISDVILDTPDLSWEYSDTVGANWDSPQSDIIYAAITNLSAKVTPFMVKFTYVPLES